MNYQIKNHLRDANQNTFYCNEAGNGAARGHFIEISTSAKDAPPLNFCEVKITGGYLPSGVIPTWVRPVAPAPPPNAVDCQGGWWPCDRHCKSFFLRTWPAQNGGKCEAESGTQRECMAGQQQCPWDLPHKSTICYGAGKDKASRDDACAGNMVCARDQYVGR